MIGDAHIVRLADDMPGDRKIGACKGEVGERRQQSKCAGNEEKHCDACQSEHCERQEDTNEIGAFGERFTATGGWHHGAQMKMDIGPAKMTGKHPANAMEKFVERDADGNDGNEAQIKRWSAEYHLIGVAAQKETVAETDKHQKRAGAKDTVCHGLELAESSFTAEGRSGHGEHLVSEAGVLDGIGAFRRKETDPVDDAEQ